MFDRIQSMTLEVLHLQGIIFGREFLAMAKAYIKYKTKRVSRNFDNINGKKNVFGNSAAEYILLYSSRHRQNGMVDCCLWHLISSKLNLVD